MAPFDPALLGPITKPIWDSLCTSLAELDPTTDGWFDHDQLIDFIVQELDANPKTIESTLDRGRRFGLVHGFKRIRATPLGRAWLTANGYHGAHGT